MLVFLTLLLVSIPAVAILYPVVFRKGNSNYQREKNSIRSELEHRWSVSLDNLKSTELEREIGNLTEEDHRALKEEHMKEAASVLKSLALGEEEERQTLETLAREIAKVRRSAAAGKREGDREGASFD